MDIHFQCHHCGQHLVVDATGGGMQIPCPHCQQPLTLPAVSAEPPRTATPGRIKLPLASDSSAPHRHTLGKHMPHISPTTPEKPVTDKSSTFLTVTAAVVVLALVVVAIANLDIINKWWSGRDQTTSAAAGTDAEFRDKARPLCSPHGKGGSITAQDGKAEFHMDIQPEAARTLAASLASLYAQTRAAQGAGHQATATDGATTR